LVQISERPIGYTARAANRVETFYDNGSRTVHFEHREVDPLNQDGKAFNGRSGALFVARIFGALALLLVVLAIINK